VSKTIPIDLLAHYQLGTTSLAALLKMVRKDGAIYGFTSASDDVVIDGVRYDGTQGLQASSLITSSGLSVDNMELTTLDDGSVFVAGEIIAGLWINAEFTVSVYNWRSPGDGVDEKITGYIGGVRIREGVVTAELRGLQQYFQQTIGSVTSKTCRARLGDGKCRKDLAAFTFTETVTGVTSNQVFAATGLVQASDYFGNGELKWLTGANAGLEHVVKIFESSQITLLLPTYFAVEVGDTFRAIAGCRHRREEDCRDKFDNVLNMQAEPDVPGVDKMMSSP